MLHSAQHITLFQRKKRNLPYNESYSPLMLAVKLRKLDDVDALLNNGADVNATTSNNESALMFAVDAMHCGLVKRLLAAGANVCQRTKKEEDDVFSILEMIQYNSFFKQKNELEQIKIELGRAAEAPIATCF